MKCNFFGGRGWIRTIEAKTQQIYSLPPLAARELSQTMRDKPESLSLFMELVMGLEPATC